MVLSLPLLIRAGEKLVSRVTGREGGTDHVVIYEVIYFALAFGIGLPPIYLFPDSDPLFYCAFCFVGVVVGGLAAQALVGRRSS
jgi:hypothetical protein